jgi:glucan phosphoethanolaminetransferase (alkaline phosphatase superfamily)
MEMLTMDGYIRNAKIYLVSAFHTTAAIILAVLILVSRSVPDDKIWFLVAAALLLFPGVFIASIFATKSGDWYAESLMPIERELRSPAWWYTVLFLWFDRKKSQKAVVVFRNNKKACILLQRGA